MFYNPIEQLVLEQFSAEPPFGVSTFPVGTLFNAPFLGQDGLTAYPNPANGILQAPRNQPVDWGVFRPILLFGAFQPHMRSQYSDQYNLTIERELRSDLKLQLSYVGSQGHRLLATHDLNYGNSQTCLDLQAIADTIQRNASDPHLHPPICVWPVFIPDSAFVIPREHLPMHGCIRDLPHGARPAPALWAQRHRSLVGSASVPSPKCDPIVGWDDANRPDERLPLGWRSRLQQRFCPRHDRQLSLQLSASLPRQALCSRVAVHSGLHVQQIVR